MSRRKAPGEPRRRSSTPWGAVQYVNTLSPSVDGVVCVSTASHGGYWVSPEVNATIPAPLRRPNGWYEEDVESAIVDLFVRGSLLPEDRRNDARALVRGQWPDEYAAITGEVVELHQSHVLRERAFLAANKDKFVTIAAFGSWHPKVPKDFVGVSATLGGDRTAATSFFLVPLEEYENRGGRFVVDPAKHERVEAF